MWEIPTVSEIVYMDRGRVTIPKAARERHGLADNARLEFFETRSGALVFKPLKAAPALSLVAHLASLRGLDIPERAAHCQGRV